MAAHEAPSDDTASFAYPPQPPLKRTRLANPAATAIVAVPPMQEQLRAPVYPEAAPSISAVNSERLRKVLTGNKSVLQFLVLEDAVSILNSCRLLRTDTTLAAACARALPEFARLVAPLDVSTTSSTISTTSSTSTTSTTPVFRLRGEWVQDLVAVSAPPELPAQVVATAAFLQKRVSHWCCNSETPQPALNVMGTEAHDEDSLCSVEPVLIPLAQLMPAHTHTSSPSSPSPSSPSSPSPKWSRVGIKTALNSLCTGGGDAFFDDKSAAESRFATHWDSIYIDRVSGRVSCRLCDAVRDSVALYRRQLALGVRQYTLMLRHKQEQWAQQTSTDIEQLTTEFREKYFPADAYIRPECGEWSESRLLRHICAHGNFQAWQIGDTRARGIASPDALVRAVSATCQHQCRTFYQPLKKTLQRKCQVLGRIPHATLQTTRLQVTQPPTDNDKRVVLTELVGGVECSSGIFSGVQLTFRLAP